MEVLQLEVRAWQLGFLAADGVVGVLGGGDPGIAARYQLFILFAIASGTALGAVLVVLSARRLLFDDRERAALTVAWLSAQTPLATIRRFVEPAVEAFTPVELVHLFTVCGMASLIQRFSAISMPIAEATTVAFMDRHDLETDALALRYPLAPVPSGVAAAA